MTAPTPTFQKNLAAIARHDPALAEQLSSTEPAELDWFDSKAGPLTATRPDPDTPRPVPLASKYDPEKEAKQLVGTIDHAKTACVVLLGFGLGYHVDQVVAKVGPRDLVVVFEPDLAQLRAVLERIDYARWLCQPGLILAGPDADKASLLGRIQQRSAVLTLGTQLLAHPVSRQRHHDAFNAFSRLVTETLAFCRTNVATALVNASRTVSNLTCNLAQYAAGSTIAELTDAARGYPAVCVGAGPSLVKNLDLLTDPAIRSNVVVIGVQTTLKPMLDRGIRPDFITALDYSSICTRFYEGLPDLPDVTLVVEPKCHPAIIAAYPGPVRVCPSDLNDKLLGKLARPMPKIKAGTTVAHLSFYLAQHLGCDPIVFIGQDLGFSDGLYYAPGTAVHKVWGPELGPFNTIETMEWTRVVRMKGNLRRAEDIYGRPIFADEQMTTYLGQFERDFAEAKQQGTTVIDATEGGMPKRHTQVKTLREALGEHATRPVPALPAADRELDPARLRQLRGLLDGRIDSVRELKRVTLDTTRLLKRLREHQHHPKKAEKLFNQVQTNTERVHGELREAFELVGSVNTVGTFRRERADRGIFHTEHDNEYSRQLAQIERDLDNMKFIEEACDEALEIFAEARTRLLDAIETNQRAIQEDALTPAA
ncbi:MAG: motility associated factor glycosyltransferase family protein [Phycisphaeraceae bacterium]